MKEAELFGEAPSWANIPPDVLAAYKSADCPIDVYCDSYIPLTKVDAPLLALTRCYAFDGDVRTTAQKFGPARIWSWVILDLCGVDPILYHLRGAGRTVGYYKTIRLQPVAPFISVPAIVEVQKSGFADVSGVTASATKTSQACAIELAVSGSASDPLVSWAPALDYSYRISLSCDFANKAVNYTIGGQHDGFPNYTIFIGETPVYHHDAIAKGQSAYSLFGSGEFDVVAKPSSVPIGR